MENRLLRVVVVLGALILAALAVLIVLLLTGDESEPGVVTIAGTDTTVIAPIDSSTSEESAAPAAQSDSTGEVVEPPVDEPEDEIELPWEEYRGTLMMETGDTEFVPVPSAASGTEFTMLPEGFSINKPWWIVSVDQPGPEGCRDSTRSLVDDPVPYDILDITDGWYACIDIDNFARFGQLRFLEVLPGGLVMAELVIWNFAPPVG